MENLRLERLKEFKSTLDKTQQVSKSMVMSLEEFIGDNVITKQVNPNKLTNLPSLTQLDTIKTIVDNEIKSEESKKSLDDSHTAEDIVTILNGDGDRALKKLLNIMYLLANARKDNVAPAIKIAAMTDEKIRYRYVENDESTTLTDILTLPLDHVYVNYKSYFEDVRSFIYGEQGSLADLPEVSPEEFNSASIMFNALINIIDAPELSEATEKTLKPITLKDILALIENTNVIIDKLESWKELAGKYWHSDEENLVLDVDIHELYKGLCTLIKDEGMLKDDDFISLILYYMFTRPVAKETI